jgi:hypothetical protein
MTSGTLYPAYLSRRLRRNVLCIETQSILFAKTVTAVGDILWKSRSDCDNNVTKSAADYGEFVHLFVVPCGMRDSSE